MSEIARFDVSLELYHKLKVILSKGGERALPKQATTTVVL